MTDLGTITRKEFKEYVSLVKKKETVEPTDNGPLSALLGLGVGLLMTYWGASEGKVLFAGVGIIGTLILGLHYYRNWKEYREIKRELRSIEERYAVEPHDVDQPAVAETD